MHYSGISNAASCTACEAGKYQLERGKTFCTRHTTCIAGEYEAVVPTVVAGLACNWSFRVLASLPQEPIWSFAQALHAESLS